METLYPGTLDSALLLAGGNVSTSLHILPPPFKTEDHSIILIYNFVTSSASE